MAALVEGLQVVDLTDLRGALAARLLADMGADVLRIAAPELPPCAPPGYLAHDCASAMAVTGTIAALVSRPADGPGDHIEISTQEASLAGLAPWSVVIEDYLHSFLVDLEHPEAGSERHTGNAIRPGNLPVRTAGPAPCLGEHTHEVLTELGLSRDEVDHLVRTGVAV